MWQSATVLLCSDRAEMSPGKIPAPPPPGCAYSQPLSIEAGSSDGRLIPSCSGGAAGSSFPCSQVCLCT